MKLSTAGKSVLEYFEGRRAQAYPDPATGGDPWTIGVGHAGGVRPGDFWTDEQIDAALASDLVKFEADVSRQIADHEATQGQFDALVLFAFNLGGAALASSTLMRKFLAGDVHGAAAEFPKWSNAAGKSMLGLRRRRAAEQSVFNGSTAEAAKAVAAMTT